MTDTVTIPRAEFEQVRVALTSMRRAGRKQGWNDSYPDEMWDAENALAILEKHGGRG